MLCEMCVYLTEQLVAEPSGQKSECDTSQNVAYEMHTKIYTCPAVDKREAISSQRNPFVAYKQGYERSYCKGVGCMTAKETITTALVSIYSVDEAN